MIHRPSIIAPRCPTCGGFTREWLSANRRRAGFASWLHGACQCCDTCRRSLPEEFRNDPVPEYLVISLTDVVPVNCVTPSVSPPGRYRVLNPGDLNSPKAIPRVEATIRFGWTCQWSTTISSYVNVAQFDGPPCDGSAIGESQHDFYISAGIGIDEDGNPRMVYTSSISGFNVGVWAWYPFPTKFASPALPVFAGWGETYMIHNPIANGLGVNGYATIQFA